MLSSTHRGDAPTNRLPIFFFFFFFLAHIRYFSTVLIHFCPVNNYFSMGNYFSLTRIIVFPWALAYITSDRAMQYILITSSEKLDMPEFP